jgi:hypothetical protein
MARLPKSWGLKEVKRPDGKLDIVGKDDAGKSYRVRTTDGPTVTDTDLKELHAADREAYSSRTEGAKTFCAGLIADGKQREQARENAFGDEMVEASGPVAYALLDRKGRSSPFSGYSRAYAENYERIFGRSN